MSDWWSNQYYGNWNTTSTATTTIRGADGNIYIGNGTVPVATSVQWTLHSDPLWLQPVTPYKVPPELLATEGAPIPESDMNWLKRRVNEICWVPA